MILTICIATVPERESLLSRLLWEIQRQNQTIVKDAFEVLVHSGSQGLGDKFNEMFKQAEGEYVVTVDDDDLIVGDYLQNVLYWLKTYNPDFLGYKILCLADGRYWMTVDHNPENLGKDWNGTERGLSNKCPIKTNIARQFIFGNDYSADATWCKEIEKSGLICKTSYIPAPMYIYDYSSRVTIGTNSDSSQYKQNIRNQRNVGNYPFDPDLVSWIQ